MKPAASMYLVARVHGLRTHLIPPRDIQILAKTKDLRDVADGLLRSDYAADISKLPTKELDAATLEPILLKTMVERFFFVPREAQWRMQNLLNRYCARFEVENIKRIIRAKHGGHTVEEANLIPLRREYTLVNFAALLKANDVDEVVSLLRETAYRPLLEKIQPYRETDTTLVLEAGLDKIYFSKVWEALHKVADRKGLTNLIGEEIDLRNLLIAFSLKARGASTNLIEETLPSPWHKVPKATLRTLLQTRLEDAPSVLPARYSKAASEAADSLKGDSSFPVERPFFRQLYDDASTALRRYSLDSGYVVAYLLLCECEAKNLVSIVIGKQLGLGEAEILQGLFGV